MDGIAKVLDLIESNSSTAFLCLLPALLLAGCGEPSDKTVSGTVLVAMADNSYSPAVLRVPVGGSVLFHNAGRSPHNALAVDNSWSTEATFGNISMGPETMTEIVFPRPGVFPYYCSFHGTPDGKGGMVGVVLVGDVEYNPAAGRNETAVEKASGLVLHVPQDYPDIQTAVDAAKPGDLVLIDRGVYNEQLFVTTPGLTLRGVDRNEVILDGRFEFGNGVMVVADGVAIENMTARNYTLNGFFWTGVKGFRGSYLTAYNNGDYGIYGFGATNGVFEYSYASGSPDSSFYIGQCDPCRVILNRVTGEYSGLGYSGTNSSGDMYVVNSTFRYNKTGVATSTFDIELVPPGHDTTIVGNVVTNNGYDDAAAFYATASLGGGGIVLAGSDDNTVERNYVRNNSQWGILMVPLNDRHYWPATGNRIRDHVVLDSGFADLEVTGLGTIGNCFSGNVHRTSMPWGLQLLNGCDGPRIPLGADLTAFMHFWSGIAQVREGHFKSRPSQDQPAPPAQANMPGGADAPVVPAAHPFEDYRLDIGTIKTPVPEAARAATAQERS